MTDTKNDKGFFIPYRHRDDVSPISYEPCARLLSRFEDKFAELIAEFEAHKSSFLRFGGSAPAPRFEQQWFARLDILAAYTIIRKHKPARIIEVGSGHSTRVMARARSDGGLETQIICIDPKPRAALLDLDVRHYPVLVNQVDMAVFDALRPGDMLFVDSSHLAQPGTDVDFLFNVVVPRLPRGAMIHVHDIFLPDPYPETWSWRGYNEQLIVAAMINSQAYMPIFASHYAVNHAALIQADSIVVQMPKVADTPDTSLWLRKDIDSVR